jgi:hypothetical protein
MPGSSKVRMTVVSVVGLLVLACNLPGGTLSEPVEPMALVEAVPSSTTTPTPVIATLAAVPSSTPTSTHTPTASPTPFGCQQPPDDTTRVKVGEGMILNQRTVWMLEHAQQLYDGSVDFMQAITQGSYHAGVSASFGTHDGGGAVDMSVRDPNDWGHIVYEDMDAIIQSLRQAGFAAWLRETGDLYADSPIHIHAIAIGDPDLSEAARTQLTGAEGYFRGFNGLPVDPPLPDTHGGPIICPWMIEMGYTDLREPLGD